jgi:hypothetical protein
VLKNFFHCDAFYVLDFEESEAYMHFDGNAMFLSSGKCLTQSNKATKARVISQLLY